MIKPIATKYNGRVFRSRLEARWAVYFDSMNIKYMYEPEGYILGNGVWYLPDFLLPEYDTFAEVKPIDLTDEELQKCLYLVAGTGKKCLLLVGEPEAKCYVRLQPSDYHDYSEFEFVCVEGKFIQIRTDMGLTTNFRKNGEFECTNDEDLSSNEDVVSASFAAKSEKFETR